MSDMNFKMIVDLVDKASPKLQQLGMNFKSLGSLMSVVAGGVVAGGLASLVKGAIDAADNMNDLSQKIGVSVENLSTLEYAAKQSGSNLDGISNALFGLSKKLKDIDDPTNKAAGVLKDLGVAVKDADGNTRDAYDIFLDLADVFKNAPNGIDKASTAMRLFGGAGKDMIPLLNEGKDGIKALQKEAESLGLKLTAETAKAADRFNDSLGKMSGLLGGAATSGASELLPTLNAIAESLTKNTNNGGGFITLFKGINLVLKVAALGVATLYTGLEQLGLTIAAVAASAALAAKGEFTAAKNVWVEWNKDIARTAEELATFSDNLNGGGDAARAVAEKLDKANKGMKGLGDNAAETTKKMEAFLEALKKEAETLGMTEVQKKRYEAQSIAAIITSDKERKAFLDKTEALLKLMQARQADVDALAAQKKLSEDNKQKLEDEAKKLAEAIKSTKEFVEQLELENSMYGLTNNEIAIAIKLHEMEAKGIKQGTAEYDELNKRLREAMTIKSDLSRLDTLLSDTGARKTKKYLEDLALLDKAFFEGVDGKFISDEEYDQGVKKLAGFKEEQKKAADEITEFWKEAAKGMQNAMSNFFFDAMQGNISDMAGSMKKMIDKMVADFLAAKAATMLFGADFGKGDGALGGFIGSMLGGFRADGGPVTAGVPYIVGEKRAEVFVPDSNGTIVPSVGQASGGNSLQINIQAMDSQDVRRLFQNDKRFLAELVNKTNREFNKR